MKRLEDYINLVDERTITTTVEKTSDIYIILVITTYKGN
jgi:hypothetical protein